MKHEFFYDISYCESCQGLCAEHRIYGEDGRPKDIDYGQVFRASLESLFERLRRDRGLDSLDFLISAETKEQIESVQTAADSVKESIMDRLDLWAFDALSPYPENRWSMRWDDNTELDGGEDWKSYLRRIAAHKEDGTYVAGTIAKLFAQQRPIALKALNIAEAFPGGKAAAMVGIEAYQETAALLVRYLIELRPNDFAEAMLNYYLGRKTNHQETIWQAKSLLFGGSLYKGANKRYTDLRHVDREMACDEYCDAFFEALDGIPVEALLKPALAAAWALRAAKWAGDKVMKKLNLPLKILWENQLAVPEQRNEMNLVSVQILAECEQLPNYELALRHYGDGISLRDLAEELGISHQAVDAKIKKLIKHARGLQES